MRFVVLLFIGVSLAGCADVPTDDQPVDETSFEDVKRQADDTTGVILGVVVDQTITPQAGVTVTLKMEEPKNTTTDEQGRFVFDQVPVGVHFMETSSPLHEPVQFTATVEAGVIDPEPIRVQVAALYSGDPFMVSIVQDGFFQCSQANFPGYWYSSSSCHDTYWVDGSDHGVTLAQERDFHADVGEGWQTQVFEMDWKSSFAGTSERMGMVVSTYKPEREGSHWFENYESGKPFRFQLDVGVPGQNVGSSEPSMLSPDGLRDMSYFVSVRPPADAACVVWCFPPGFAIEQEFTTYLNQFYYLPAPEGWSMINGDEDPF